MRRPKRRGQRAWEAEPQCPPGARLRAPRSLGGWGWSQVVVGLGDGLGSLGKAKACDHLRRRWGRTRWHLRVKLAPWERRVPSGRGASEARGQQGGGSSPGDNGSSCPWGACPHAAGWECKEQPDPRNVTVLFLLQVSRGSRAQRGMDPVSSRSPPGPTRSRSSPNKCVSSEVSPWESFLSGDEQPPGPQEESADPVDTCPRGTQAPVHSGPAAFLRAAQEMPQEGGETPPCKREHGATAGSSTASKEILPRTDGKEQGPGPQGDVHGPSPSGPAEWAPLQSEGAPRGQSGQVSDSPSISHEGM